MKPAVVPADAKPPPGRTIGEILLARSLVTDEELDEAIAIQRETGKPLGQILVEAGTITRLELASALAEQWGDAGTISPTFPGGSAYVDPVSSDGDPTAQLEELRRTRRALEERMLAFERTATDAQWQQEIATGVRALFGRVDVLEATIGERNREDDAAYLGELRQAVVELAQRVEAVTPELESLRERVDGAASVGGVQHGLSELGERIDVLSTAVAAADARAGSVSERLEEVARGLAGALDELRRSAQHTAATQVELGARLDEAIGHEIVVGLQHQLDDLRTAVAEVVERPAAGTELSARVDALSEAIGGRADEAALRALGETVAELAARPAADPALAGRLDDLATRLDELAERLELGAGVTERDGEPDPRIDALIARVAEIAARPAADPELEARVADATARLDALVAEVAGSAGAAPELESQLAQALHRIDEIAAEVATRPGVDPALESRVQEVAHRVDAVAAELAGRADAAGQAELSRLVAELAERPSGDPILGERLAELAARVEELTARPVADLSLASRVDELAERVERAAAAGEPDPRVEALAAGLAELAGRVEALGERPSAESLPADLSESLAAAGGVADAVRGELAAAAAAWAEERREMEARIEWLAARVEAAASAAPVPAPPASAARATPSGEASAAAVDADVERLRMAVERLMLDFAEHRRALSATLPSRDLEDRLRKLTEHVDELTGAVTVGVSEGNGGPPSGGSIDRELTSQVKALVGRLEEVEASATAGRETMLARLERMMGTIDWRLQRLENPGSSS